MTRNANPQNWIEWRDWAASTARPSDLFRSMNDVEMQRDHPQLFALKGVQQEPAWHPEGDVFEHSMHVADSTVDVANERGLDVERRIALVFGGVAHDMGKPKCTVFVASPSDPTLRWRSPEHDTVGQPIAEAWMRSLGAPEHMVIRVGEMARHHMFHVFIHKATRRIVQRRMNRLVHLTGDELFAIIESDQRGRPGLRPDELEMPAIARDCERIWQQIENEPEPPPPILTGKDLIGIGLTPGPHFGEIIKAASNAHATGKITTTAEALDIARSMSAS